MGSQRGFSKAALELLLPLDPVLVSGELLGEGLEGLCGNGWRGRAGRGTLRVVLCPGTGVIWGLVVPGWVALGKACGLRPLNLPCC